ncbi:Response regulator [uncultured Gammaproteobacteria bacterium]
MATILIADDEDTVRKTLKLLLEDAGHSVLLARDGLMAVEIVKLQAVDVMFCDIIMPEKEGIQTIAEVRRLCPQTKIIAISGGGRTQNFDYLQMAEKVGATKALRKPFNKKELLEALNGCLNQGH